MFQHLGLATLVGVVGHHDNPAHSGNKVHRAAHAFDELSGDHPVCQIAILGHFHRAKDRHRDLATPDHAKAGRAVEIDRLRKLRNRLLAGIDQIGIFIALEREWPHAQHAVLGLQRDVHTLRNVVCHQRRNADAEIHIHAVFKFLRGPRRHLIAIPGHQALSFLRTVRCSIRFSNSPCTRRCT